RGSRSDRTMNRHGDTPAGMVESALECVRIARKHDYHDIVLSMKASNPKVMIQAYRLLVARMDEEGIDPYPLHLGVTEAGLGEDGRIKSAVGIGALLDDGLGDTVRVSLTEEPEAEVPVARRLVAPYNQGLRAASEFAETAERIDPYSYVRRASTPVAVDGDDLEVLLRASTVLGSLLCDGIGDSVGLSAPLPDEDLSRLLFNILQGAGVRVTKTEFVSCPSCGRTLFDLQTTTERIASQTKHLKGVKIAIMGCVVNGPGEMADADFGYVGGSPGHVNLYVGKEVVEKSVPEAHADARLVDLIRRKGKWQDPATL